MPRYYIIVGSPDNFAITQGLGCKMHGIKSRRRKTAEQFAKGDKVVFYLTGLQAWGGVCTITGPAYEDHTPLWTGKKDEEDYPHRFPMEPEVILGAEKALPVEPMVPDLEYLTKWPAQHWRLGFQGNVHEIGERDYRLIHKAIAAQAQKPVAKKAAPAAKKAAAKKPAPAAKKK